MASKLILLARLAELRRTRDRLVVQIAAVDRRLAQALRKPSRFGR